jgi:hypothetical protein
MPLPDASADAVFSCNALQFVDVPSVLAEVRRVLRPGGICYAHFGPIWSAPDGHQLEYVTYRGRDLVFWRDTLLPPYAHLQYERAQLAEVLATALPAELVELLVRHVYDDDTVNRLFLEDYVAAVRDSGLVCQELTTSDHLDYPIRPPHFRSPPAWTPTADELHALVAARAGAPRRLGIRDVRLVLTAPGRTTTGTPCRSPSPLPKWTDARPAPQASHQGVHGGDRQTHADRPGLPGRSAPGGRP